MTHMLAEFLLARITEDEADARRAAKMRYDVPTDAPWVSARLQVERRTATSYGPHQARWSPDRVLAECEAKRKVIGYVSARDGYADQAMLEALAQPYADHVDYRPEWRA